jgi:hypothetical protein
VAGSLWVFALIHRVATLFVFPQFFIGVVLLGSVWTFSRAVRVNEPIAARPPRTRDRALHPLAVHRQEMPTDAENRDAGDESADIHQRASPTTARSAMS